jgi:hypothetical protein
VRTLTACLLTLSLSLLLTAAPAPLPDFHGRREPLDASGEWLLEVGESRYPYRVLLHKDGRYECWSGRECPVRKRNVSYTVPSPEGDFDGVWERQGNLIRVWEWSSRDWGPQRHTEGQAAWAALLSGEPYAEDGMKYTAAHRITRVR